VISACSFCLWLVLLSLPLIQSFVTSLLNIEGSNLLVTRSVISSFSFSLHSSSFSYTVAFSCARSSSSWDSQRLSRSFVTGRVCKRSICSSHSHCDFYLLLFRVRYLYFLFFFRSCSLLLRLCRFLFLPFLSLSSASFTTLIGAFLRRHSLIPRQWYQLLVAPLLKIPLILS
jgi:hypothetical protein